MKKEGVKTVKKEITEGHEMRAASSAHLLRSQERSGKLGILFILPVMLAAGFLNGLSGAGGGMILGIFLPFYFGEDKTDHIFAYSSLSVLLFSTVSATIYFFLGQMTLSGIFRPILPAVVGGAFGGYLLKKIKPTLIKLLFSLLLIYSGVRFLWA